VGKWSRENMENRINERKAEIDTSSYGVAGASGSSMQERAKDGAFCGGADCPHRQTLRNILGETIDALEQTRKSFKSKQIETLRKKLIGILLEII
jgi:hypothetical protein